MLLERDLVVVSDDPLTVSRTRIGDLKGEAAVVGVDICHRALTEAR